MRGTKAAVVDYDYEVGADVQEGRLAGNEKPLSSRYRGVCWNRKNRRWQAAINSGGKYVYLGSFLSEYDAARAFDKAAVKLRGTRAKLNFPYSEYVDQNGNLLEDPKMKNVMFKIEAIQGAGVPGGSGGSAAITRHHSGCSGGGGENRAHGGGADEGHLLHADGPPLPLPLPLPPSQLHEDLTVTQPGVEPSRQLSPLVSAGGGSSTGGGGGTQGRHQHQHLVGPSDSGKDPDWHSSHGGSLQTGPILNLAAPPTAPPPPQHQHQQRAQPHSVADGPTLYPQFQETVTTGGSGLPQSTSASGGGDGGGSLVRGLDMALQGPPLSVHTSTALVMSGRMPYTVRGRVAGTQTPSPLLHMYGSGGGFDAPHAVMLLPPTGLAAPAAGAVATTPQHSATGPLPRIPTSAVQRALLRELTVGGSHITFLRFVDNRFQGNPEDTCGALYLDGNAPGRVGSAVWNGKCVIRMGMYDTERDACQASIRCMQLNCMFRLDQPRADLFNAMTDLAVLDCAEVAAGSVTGTGAGGGGGGGGGQDVYRGGLQAIGGAGVRGAPRGSCNGSGLVLGDTTFSNPHVHAHFHSYHHAAHSHHPALVYGPRGSGGGGGCSGLSYHGPECGNAVSLLQQRQQHQQQQQQGSPPRTVDGGQRYGSVYDPRANGSVGATLHLSTGHRQLNMNSLFQAVRQCQNGMKGIHVTNSRATGGGGNSGDGMLDALQDGDGAGGGDGGGGGGGVLSKCLLQADLAALHELAQSHRAARPGGEIKRMRLEASGGGGLPLELQLEPPSKEFHDAHKMPLAMVIKTWQHQQQQAATGAL